MNLKIKIPVIVISFLFVLLVLDKILFGYIFLKFPNEMEWDTSPWYNFLHKRNSINFGTDESGILISGSSVALYSILPEKLEAELNQKSNQKYKIDFYSHVAMAPTDLYYYLDDIISKKPKKLIYLLNPADLQFDYFREVDNSIVYDENIRVHDFARRYPGQIYYPFPFLMDHISKLNKREISFLATKSFLLINRYRNLISDPIFAFIERHFRSGRSYHEYTGIIPEEGIWRKGWTPQNFRINCELTDSKLRESIYIHHPGTKVSIFENGILVYSNIYNKKQWHSLEIELKKTGNVNLNFDIDKVTTSREVNPKEIGKIYSYGVRLSQNFCKKEIENNISYNRKKGLDDKRFLDMSIEEYKQDYNDRMYLNTETRPELWRMNHLNKIKIKLKDQPFQLFTEMAMVEGIIKKLKQNNIEIILINNPENPIELEKYSKGQWYGGYLNYLQTVTKENNVPFYDLKDYLKEERYFMDPHHLTYHGAEEMNSKYVEIILNSN